MEHHSPFLHLLVGERGKIFQTVLKLKNTFLLMIAAMKTPLILTSNVTRLCKALKMLNHKFEHYIIPNQPAKSATVQIVCFA